MKGLELLGNNLKSNFYEYFKFFWPLVSTEQLSLSPHIEFICNDVQKLGQSILNSEIPEHKWNLYNVPPGSSKSTIISILFPTWLIANDSGLYIINTSYSGDLSTGFVRKSLTVIKSETYQLLFDVKLGKTTEGEYETTKNGGQYSTSTGGTVTGKHGNLTIIDDPESVEQSYSKAERDKVNRFITTTLPDRVRDKQKAPMLMIMQRLHEEDPTGNIISKNLNTKHICLPAELGKNTTLGLEYLYTDGYLCPARIGPKVCMEKKKELGSFGYAGQYEQNPTPKGGGKIKREWFNVIHEKELPDNLKWDLWIDGAYTKVTTNDPTGMILTAFHNNMLYVKHGHHDWLTMPAFLKFIKQYCSLNGMSNNSMIHIEPKASGHSMKQMVIDTTDLNCTLIKTKLVNEGKVARLEVASPKAESGRVTVVKGNWNEEFYHQLEGFPAVKHDEYVDVLGYAVDFYFNKTTSSGVGSFGY